MIDGAKAVQRTSVSALAKWLPLLTEVWITGVIAAFFVIRILGSKTAQQFLHKMGH